MKASTRHLSTLFSLSEKQFIALEMHSVINIINVIFHQIQSLKPLDQTGTHILKLRELYSDFLKDLLQSGILDGKKIRHFEEATFASIADISSKYKNEIQIEDIEELLKDIFHVLELRKNEQEAVKGKTFKSLEITPEEIRTELLDFLHVVEKNSLGSYSIVKKVTEQTSKDYLVRFQIHGERHIKMNFPLLLKDVFRDLIGNARKYTPPGGSIFIDFTVSQEKIRFVVEDTGVGIPENEIDRVFHYGYRASNVRNRATMGGGFGLTKALYVTTQCSGNLWVDSVLNKGTKITLEVPLSKNFTS